MGSPKMAFPQNGVQNGVQSTDLQRRGRRCPRLPLSPDAFQSPTSAVAIVLGFHSALTPKLVGRSAILGERCISYGLAHSFSASTSSQALRSLPKGLGQLSYATPEALNLHSLVCSFSPAPRIPASFGWAPAHQRPLVRASFEALLRWSLKVPTVTLMNESRVQGDHRNSFQGTVAHKVTHDSDKPRIALAFQST